MYIISEPRTQNPEPRKRGFILLLTLIFMAVLTIMTGAMMYMVSYQTRAVGPQVQDTNLESLADAGIEKAHRTIRDDYSGSAPSPGSAQGAADLRGGDASLSVSVGTQDNIRYIDGSVGTINSNTDQAILRTFDSNYTNTRIISVVPYIRASRQTGGSGATIQFSYTTNGSAYTTVLTQVLPNSATPVDYAGTVISGLTWDQIMSANFRLRAMRTAGNRTVNIDAMYLRVTYSIDTLKESWAMGDYATFPISLGNGAIQSVVITDESSKVHINYASQSLLANLLSNLGIASANTKAANIVSYRGALLTNPFDSVEELQQVSGITAPDYAAIKDYVTVYSFINSNVYRPTGPRAPININTASFEVLKSVFDSLSLGAGDAASLANAIITFRNSTPFTCFYSSNAAVTTDFNDFVISQGYVSGASSPNPNERDIVLDTADASSFVPVSGRTGYNCPTTELCYSGYSFMIDCVARYNNRDLRTKTIRGNDGSHTFYTYAGDPALSGWRKENFE